jgi:hypothetical protein
MLRSRGLAAVPTGGEILLLASRLATPVVMEDEDWRAEVRDTGRFKTLDFSNRSEAQLLAQLLERRLLAEVVRKTNWWKLDSVRIWFEKEPFRREFGIAAFRRFEISSIVIEDSGVGLVVDIGTAFFTTASVAEFFRTDVTKEDRAANLRRFDRLSLRQKGQKATLLYDCGKTKSKCYFEKVNPGETCATTGELLVKRKAYPSLFAYYRDRQSELGVKESDPVARVSFQYIDHPTPVAANRLYLRVMNAVLPPSLDDVDKIAPEARRWLIQGFWDTLKENPLGEGLPTIRSGFWRPDPDRMSRCPFPGLLFGRNSLLMAPDNGDPNTSKQFFQGRMLHLREKGCFNVPATVIRAIHLAVPETVDEAAALDLGDAISGLLSKWTKQSISVLAPQRYTELSAGIEALNGEARPGISLFVFEDQDPAAYYMVASELKLWRVKRITVHQLESSHQAYVRFAKVMDKNGKPHKAVRDWRSFTEMCALDLLQQMNCVPWRPAAGLNYDAHLAIDVGHDRRYYAISLLVCRGMDKQPHFWLDTLVEVKADHKKETINEVHLKTSILKLFHKARKIRDPIGSLLVLRDGRECGREMEGIYAAKDELVKEGLLMPGAKLDVVDFHKKSLKGIRLWDCAEGGVRNVMEGTYVLLGSRDAVLADTGRATLHQGTVGPVMLCARTDGVMLEGVLEDVHASSHLNWSSPRVAQSLPIELKRTDEQLESRTAQEIRRIR